MNIINSKVYYKNFRNLIVYKKALELVKKQYKYNINDFNSAKEIKEFIRIALEIAISNGYILTEKGEDYHLRRAVSCGLKLKEKYINNKEIVSDLNEILRILYKIRKNLEGISKGILKGEGDKKMKKVKSEHLKKEYMNIEGKVNNLKHFRDLKGYQIALDFYKKLHEVLIRMPAIEQYGIFDQVERASTSIVANLAEGNEYLFPKKKVNFYAVSLATANECQAWLDVMKIKGYVSLEEYRELDSMLEEIKKLIIAYIRAVDIPA